MELLVWPENKCLRLPTVDSQCLSVIAYCRFSGVGVKIRQTHPFHTYSCTLPVFIQNGKKMTGVQEIFSYLRSQNQGADFTLTKKQSADNLAYMALISEKLVPALEHMWWMDEANFDKVTRGFYAQAIMFPVGLIYTARMCKHAIERVTHLTGDGYLTEKDRQNKIYVDAKECLNTLSTILGEKDYFFGKDPTSLDAIVFGYLAPLYKAHLPSAELQNHLNGCPNLCAFCKRIMDKYFQLTEQEEEEYRKIEEKRKQKERDQLDFPNKKRDFAIAGLFAASALAAFAYSTGRIGRGV